MTASPSADGMVSGGGSYAADTPVTVTATANSGYQFVNWTENGVQVSTSASYAFSMSTSDIDLVANFTAVSSPGGGGGGGISSSSSSTSTSSSNTRSATIDPGTGGTVSLGGSASVTIPEGVLQGSGNVGVAITNASSPPLLHRGIRL